MKANLGERQTIKFCKKCHKCIVEKITDQRDLFFLKYVCSGTLFEVDESLRDSVGVANKGRNKENRIVNSAHKRGCH